MFTHLAATLTGLSTVRAYNAEQILETEFDYHQDTHSACWYMFIATSSAFGLSLDIMCLIFISCIILYYMVIDTNVSGDKVGLAVTQAMSLTGMLQWGKLNENFFDICLQCVSFKVFVKVLKLVIK